VSASFVLTAFDKDSGSTAQEPAHAAAAFRTGRKGRLCDRLPLLEAVTARLTLILVRWHDALLFRRFPARRPFQGSGASPRRV